MNRTAEDTEPYKPEHNPSDEFCIRSANVDSNAIDSQKPLRGREGGERDIRSASTYCTTVKISSKYWFALTSAALA